MFPHLIMNPEKCYNFSGFIFLMICFHMAHFFRMEQKQKYFSMRAVFKIAPPSGFLHKLINGVLLFVCIDLFAYALLSLFMIVQWLFWLLDCGTVLIQIHSISIVSRQHHIVAIKVFNHTVFFQGYNPTGILVHSIIDDENSKASTEGSIY